MPDAFDRLGLPARFDLSVSQVRAAYLARVHNNEADTESFNAAKGQLMDPESRANLLLARLGGPAKEASRELPDGFLLEVMQAREGMEEAASKRDPIALQQWRDWAERERSNRMEGVSLLFASLQPESEHDGGGGGARRDSLLALRRELNAWRYLERMLEQIDNV